MKLLNHTLKYLSVSLLLILSIWAVIFYFNMLDEVYDSIDDGLENYKLLIIEKAQQDTTILYKTAFNESNYAINEITIQEALQVKDTYRDSVIYSLNEKDLEPVRVLTSAFESGGNYYKLMVISSMVEEDDLVEDLFYALLWLYAFLLVVIILVNNVLLRKIWKPFYEILHQLKTFQLGKSQNTDTAKTNVKEFRELKVAVNALLKRSLETYNNQKQFTENASHELQTPLAIGINKLELLVEQNDFNEAQLKHISEVLEVLERLTRLNKSLLQLARIENNQFQNREIVSINEIARNQIADFSDLADYKEVAIFCNEEGDLTPTMDDDLANILLANLIKNALLHNLPGGRVDITITSTKFTICNSGKASPLDPEKIFNRFYKETITANNTGLGLSIVKAIVDIYGFSINYTYKEKHCIELLF